MKIMNIDLKGKIWVSKAKAERKSVVKRKEYE